MTLAQELNNLVNTYDLDGGEDTDSFVTEVRWLRDRYLKEQAPLVIVYVGGGMVQNWTAKEGVGEPRVFVIDWDREGQYGSELDEFADQLVETSEALGEYAGTINEVKMLNRAAEGYRNLAASGETASRYR